MKAKNLIDALLKLPLDAEVKLYFNGVSHIDCDSAWLAHSGNILVGNGDSYISCNKNMPDGTVQENKNDPHYPLWGERLPSSELRKYNVSAILARINQ